MIPVLHFSNETDFMHNGIGMLTDCVSCEVAEESNGFFELSMKYPLNGKKYNDLNLNAIIKCKSNSNSNAQLFRIYSINRIMENFTQVDAQHISYDLSGIPVSPFSATTVKEAVNSINTKSFLKSRFKITTDIDFEIDYNLTIPKSARSVIFEIAESCGSEIEFDNFEVKLSKSRGVDRGFFVRYGKNMQSLQQDEHCANVINGIVPYWYNNQNGDLVMPDKPVYLVIDEELPKVVPVDLTKYFKSKPTLSALTTFAAQYIKDNQFGKPEVSIDVSFLSEDKNNVFLYDIVNVFFPELKVNVKSKVNKVVYNVLLDKISSVSIGTVKRSTFNIK